MGTAILTIVGAIGTAIAGVIAYKCGTNKNRQEAEQDIAEKKVEIEAKKAMIKEAVYTANDAKLNEIVISLMQPAVAILIAVLVGCTSSPNVVYVPTDRKIESCTNSLGIACKAVPDAVMVEMLERLQELQDLKTELKVDKRIGK